MAKKFVSKKSQTGSKRCVWNGSKLYTKSGYTKKKVRMAKKFVSKKSQTG